MDIDKQVAYWRTGAREDLQVASDLLEKGHTRHGLFFLHLALEKILKAHVSRITGDFPPRIHNLARLAAESGVAFTETQMVFLAEMNQYNIEGRYPEYIMPVPSGSIVDGLIRDTGEMFAWLMKQLENR